MNEEIPSEVAECATELTRIFGEVDAKRFLLLPFQTMAETITFLRSIPDGAGQHGVLAALERRNMDAATDDESKL